MLKIGCHLQLLKVKKYSTVDSELKSTAVNILKLDHFVCVEKEVATNFLRTISSQGSRPVDPASKAAVHRTRVRSAVMTPSRKMRQEQKTAQNEYKKLSK